MVMKSILAGVLISLSCIASLHAVGVLGMFLFSFGVMSICLCNLKLYSATTSPLKFNLIENLKALFWNVIGCLLVSLHYKVYRVVELDDKVYYRITDGPWLCFINALFCGLIIAVMVDAYRRHKTIIPIIVGVPLIIIPGFHHSIADAFTFLCFYNWTWDLLWIWICEVIGNFIGFSIYNLTVVKYEV